MIRSLSILLLLAAHTFGQIAVPFAQCDNGQCNNNPRMVWEAPQSQSVPFPARCRIRTSNGFVGSGTLVCRTDSDATIITAFHVVKDSDGTAIVEFPQSGRFAGNVVAKDEFYDLAAIKIGPCNIEPLELGDDLTGTLAAGGFGPDNTFRTIHGTVAGYVLYSQDPNTEQMPVISGSVRSGDSGGAVTNSQKKMVGVVWGAVDGRTYITTGGPLRKLVQQVCGNHGQNLVPVTPAPQPLPPPVPHGPQQPPAQPQIDWPAKYDKLESDFAELNAAVYKLQKQVASYKECNCGNSEAHVTAAEVNGAITSAIASIHFPQPEKPQPPNYDAIAAEISKRLPPINMRVTAESPYQSVKLGSYVTLPLDKQNP